MAKQTNEKNNKMVDRKATNMNDRAQNKAQNKANNMNNECSDCKDCK